MAAVAANPQGLPRGHMQRQATAQACLAAAATRQAPDAHPCLQQAPVGCDLRDIGRSSPGRVFQGCRRTEPVSSGRCKPCFGEWRGAGHKVVAGQVPTPPLAILIGDEG